MLYLFYGTDKNKALHNALKIIEKKVSEKSDALVFKIDEENFSKDLLIEMCGGQGLFAQKYIVHVKNVCEDEEMQKIFFDFLKDVQTSENIFILTEGDLNKKDLSKIEKYTEKIWEYSIQKKNKDLVNVFKIADHIYSKDKKNLWIEYCVLRAEDIPVEEIHGILFWGFKNMMLASKTLNASDAGLKPFVYSKAKKASEKYSQDELEEKFWQLTKLLGDSRRGEGDLEILLEKWILHI